MTVSFNGPGLWYATRAAGLVTLLLLTLSALLGVLTAGRFASPTWPRFLTVGLHRNLSLLALVFVALHIATTVLDSYTSIQVSAAFIPFISSYKRGWLGLGAIALAQPTLRAAGGAMGAGIVIALPVTSCGLAETARVVRYLAEETAGQCGPCVMGLPALADALADLAYQGGRGRALDQISRLLPVIEGRGACRHPDGATKLVRSALRTFSAEVQWHDQRGACYGVRRDPLLPVPGDEEREWGWK